MAALVSIDDDEERARTTARRAIVGLFHPVPHPYYDHLLRVQGHADVADAASELAPQKRWAEATAAIERRAPRRPDDHRHARPVRRPPAGLRRRASEVICLDLGRGGPDALFAALADARA